MSAAPTARVLDGVAIPPLVYGTAWKEERTEPLVLEALRAGFRGVDTANQRKHYHEEGVGLALGRAFDDGIAAREDLFIQTKFTYARGQDHRLPYDPQAPIAVQVAQSFDSSLSHLGVERLDAYLLHGPSVGVGIGPADHEAWRAMEALQRDGRARLLGVSNVTLDQLHELHEFARVKPRIVQNRTFTRPDADSGVRGFCEEQGIAYEGFSLLTAIPHVLSDHRLHVLASALARTPAEIVFAYCLARGMIALTGTTSATHMKQDLAAPDLVLDDETLALLDALVRR